MQITALQLHLPLCGVKSTDAYGPTYGTYMPIPKLFRACRLLLLMGGFLLFFIAFSTVHAVFKVRPLLYPFPQRASVSSKKLHVDLSSMFIQETLVIPDGAYLLSSLVQQALLAGMLSRKSSLV